MIYLPKNFDWNIFYLHLRPMKFVPKKFLAISLLAIAMLCATLGMAMNSSAVVENPPPPTPPPPPGLPIDSNLIILIVCALALGFYTTLPYMKKARN